MRIFRNTSRLFSLQLDPNDSGIRRQLYEKVIPWSSSPFDNTISDAEAEKTALLVGDEREEPFEHNAQRAVPTWIQLFFDPTSTHATSLRSGLTSKTPIKDSRAIQSYVVFFVLVMWLWVQQVVIIQTITGIVPFWSSNSSSSSLSRASLQALTSMKESFILMEKITYCDNMAYFRHGSRTRSIFSTIASLIASSVLFLTSLFFIDIGRPIFHVIKFALWLVAIGIEMGVYLRVAEPYGLLPHTSISERLAGLAPIIIGESLNGLIDPLVNIAKSFAFNATSALQIGSLALTVFLKLRVFTHFPLFICIVLLIEGMKGILLIITFSPPLNAFYDRFGKIQQLSDLEPLFADLGLDFAETSNALSKLDNGPDPVIAKSVNLMRLYTAGIIALSEQFDILSGDVKAIAHSYLFNQSPNELLDDFMADYGTRVGFLPTRFLAIKNMMKSEQESPLAYISIAGACFLASLLLLLLLRLRTTCKQPLQLSLLVGGMFATKPLARDDAGRGMIDAFLPTITAILALEFIIDYTIHWFMARNLKRRGLWDTGLAMELSSRNV
ncbi:hypothetical protein BKA62DRAFT_773783 [Auriculariales sp. MPI-PUGE-AT-0066]|nr:hypothetical protein BKA62DRAFT_773783 [Auriculariales sp. MPI-PUGE-AT-0066]